MSKTFTRILLACGIFGASVAGAMAGAQVAKADDLSFLDKLTSYGLVITDASLAIHNGHGICEIMRDGAEPEDVAKAVYQVSQDNGGEFRTLSDARAFVLSAGEELCPDQGVYAPGNAHTRQL